MQEMALSMPWALCSWLCWRSKFHFAESKTHLHSLTNYDLTAEERWPTYMTLTTCKVCLYWLHSFICHLQEENTADFHAFCNVWRGPRLPKVNTCKGTRLWTNTLLQNSKKLSGHGDIALWKSGNFPIEPMLNMSSTNPNLKFSKEDRG